MSITQVATLVIGVGIGLIVLIAIARTVRIVPQASTGIVERLGRYHRTLEPGLHFLVPFIDRLRPLVDMREQVVSVPAAAGDHAGQRDDLDRYGLLLHGDRRVSGHVRGREPPVRDRAADGDDSAQRDRLDRARGRAHLARQDQRRPPHRPRRGNRALGPAGEPDRAQVDRPAELDPGGDGEADARRARAPRRDHQRRGRQAGADHDRRGREAGRDPDGRRREDGDHPHRRGQQAVGDPPRRRRSGGDASGLPGDPRRQPVARPPHLPVHPEPADAWPTAGR